MRLRTSFPEQIQRITTAKKNNIICKDPTTKPDSIGWTCHTLIPSAPLHLK